MENRSNKKNMLNLRAPIFRAAETGRQTERRERKRPGGKREEIKREMTKAFSRNAGP